MKLWLKCWKTRSYFTFPFECRFMIPKLCIFVNSVGWKIAAVFSCLISQSYLHCLSPYCAIGHCTEGPQLFTKKPKHLKAVSVWPLGRACPFGHTTFSNVGVLLSNWASVHILLWCSILQLMQVNIYSSVLKLQVMNMPLHPSLIIFQKDCCMFIVWYTLSFNPM